LPGSCTPSSTRAPRAPRAGRRRAARVGGERETPCGVTTSLVRSEPRAGARRTRTPRVRGRPRARRVPRGQVVGEPHLERDEPGARERVEHELAALEDEAALALLGGGAQPRADRRGEAERERGAHGPPTRDPTAFPVGFPVGFPVAFPVGFTSRCLPVAFPVAFRWPSRWPSQ
jgi:hypothetical protein